VPAASLAEWIAAIAALVTVFIAAWIGLQSFRQQRTSADVQLALSVFGEINRYWDRIADTDSGQAKHDTAHDIGQILGQFELAAALFNRRTLSKAALPILKHHIIEVYTSLINSEHGRKLIDDCRSADSTLVELDSFLKRHLPAEANPAGEASTWGWSFSWRAVHLPPLGRIRLMAVLWPLYRRAEGPAVHNEASSVH
jgi:hypothetical protein